MKEDWKKVLWTDEASFSTDSAGKIRVWCKSDEIYDPSALKELSNPDGNQLWYGDA